MFLSSLAPPMVVSPSPLWPEISFSLSPIFLRHSCCRRRTPPPNGGGRPLNREHGVLGVYRGGLEMMEYGGVLWFEERLG
ncbi:hypothetical protein HanRHA438_Chr16g0746161 [Helianthus annuus]|nr:hypothetical protein HanRHA438_Chr16g0746161 [Helianthus annuus]